jgi:hypothetical protein
MAAANPVRWTISERNLLCSECREIIPAGDLFATWVDRSVDGYHTCFSLRVVYLLTPRHYCAECAQLLEDSLTTSESLETV